MNPSRAEQGSDSSRRGEPPVVGPDLSRYRRIVLLTEGYSTPFLAKTAISLARYRANDVAALLDSQASAGDVRELFGIDADIPVVKSLAEVDDVDAIFIGIAPPGGKLPAAWHSIFTESLGRGIDLVSGLHDFLIDNAEFVALAERTGSRLIDVRRNSWKETATGQPFRPGCLRVQTVGHDCTVGKMVVSIEVQRELARRGEDAKFLATGQTGIMISGEGVPADCVVSDFINGAIEQLVRDNERHNYLLIEGQGSLSHPAFSAVTLGLLHGAAPDGLIFCYEAGRDHVKGLDGIRIPPTEALIEALETVAALRHPCKVIGIGINTRGLSRAAAETEVRRASERFQLPACDVYREGAAKLADAVVELRRQRVTE